MLRMSPPHSSGVFIGKFAENIGMSHLSTEWYSLSSKIGFCALRTEFPSMAQHQPAQMLPTVIP